MCTKETAAFQSCYSAFKKQNALAKEEKLKGVIPFGSNARLSGEQINMMMKKFPLSTRMRKDYFDPKFKNP